MPEGLPQTGIYILSIKTPSSQGLKSQTHELERVPRDSTYLSFMTSGSTRCRSIKGTFNLQGRAWHSLTGVAKEVATSTGQAQAKTGTCLPLRLPAQVVLPLPQTTVIIKCWILLGQALKHCPQNCSVCFVQGIKIKTGQNLTDPHPKLRKNWGAQGLFPQHWVQDQAPASPASTHAEF